MKKYLTVHLIFGVILALAVTYTLSDRSMSNENVLAAISAVFNVVLFYTLIEWRIGERFFEAHLVRAKNPAQTIAPIIWRMRFSIMFYIGAISMMVPVMYLTGAFCTSLIMGMGQSGVIYSDAVQAIALVIGALASVALNYEKSMAKIKAIEGSPING